jgi:hypothetical protein
MSGWMQDSRRFKSFVAQNGTKIRSKLRGARDVDGLLDLRAELETAALLLRDDRFTLEFEKYAAGRQRGPDFTVTFKTHTPFHVEVRRFRTTNLEKAATRALSARLIAVLCDKVGQMLPGAVNLLWIVDETNVKEADLNEAATTLRRLADGKQETFFTRRGFGSAAHFLRQFSRLSGVVLHHADTNVYWANTLARRKAPAEIVLAIRRMGSS